jgi:hypothetical protein
MAAIPEGMAAAPGCLNYVSIWHHDVCRCPLVMFASVCGSSTTGPWVLCCVALVVSEF